MRGPGAVPRNALLSRSLLWVSLQTLGWGQAGGGQAKHCTPPLPIPPPLPRILLPSPSRVPPPLPLPTLPTPSPDRTPVLLERSEFPPPPRTWEKSRREPVPAKPGRGGSRRRRVRGRGVGRGPRGACQAWPMRVRRPGGGGVSLRDGGSSSLEGGCPRSPREVGCPSPAPEGPGRSSPRRARLTRTVPKLTPAKAGTRARSSRAAPDPHPARCRAPASRVPLTRCSQPLARSPPSSPHPGSPPWCHRIPTPGPGSEGRPLAQPYSQRLWRSPWNRGIWRQPMGVGGADRALLPEVRRSCPAWGPARLSRRPPPPPGHSRSPSGSGWRSWAK